VLVTERDNPHETGEMWGCRRKRADVNKGGVGRDAAEPREDSPNGPKVSRLSRGKRFNGSDGHYGSPLELVSVLG